MKKLIIATSVLFAFSSVFAQKEKPNVKPTKSIYQSKTQDARTPSSKPAAVSNEAKPNKPVGPSTKPATKPAPNVSKPLPVVSKPAPVMTKDSPVKGGSKPLGISTNKASQSAVGTAKEKPSSNIEKKEKGSSSRASQSAVGTATAKEKPSLEIEKKEEKTKRPVEVDEKSPIDPDFCKGWADGFKKTYQQAKVEFNRIPRCENDGKCRGYACGYEAGINKADSMLK